MPGCNANTLLESVRRRLSKRKREVKHPNQLFRKMAPTNNKSSPQLQMTRDRSAATEARERGSLHLAISKTSNKPSRSVLSCVIPTMILQREETCWRYRFKHRGVFVLQPMLTDRWHTMRSVIWYYHWLTFIKGKQNCRKGQKIISQGNTRDACLK